MRNETTQRLSLYEQLDSDSRLLLEYLSFVFEPLSKRDVVDQFRTYLKEYGGSVDGVERMISRLHKQGQLQTTGTMYSCAEDIVEEISTRAALEGRAYLQCESAQNQRPKDWDPDPFVLARIALYQNRIDDFWRIAHRHDGLAQIGNGSELLHEKLWRGICTRKPLDFAPSKVSAKVADHGLVHSLNRAVPVPHLMEWLEDNNAHEEVPQDMWHYQLLLRGREKESDGGGLVLECCKKILEGDLTLVHTLADELIKGESQLDISFAGQEFIFVVGCYAEGLFEAVEERLKNGHESIRPLMRWFWELRTGRRTDLSPELRTLMKEPDFPPLVQFFSLCLLHWGGLNDELEAGRVFTLATRFEEAGYEVLSKQLFSLHRYLNGNKEALTPFLWLLQPTERWKATLTQLEHWTALLQDREEESVEERVAWILDPRKAHRKDIVAKVQKRSKSGRWTHGRRTALEDLQELGDDVLDDHDQKILQVFLDSRLTIAQRRKEYIKALIGHPRIFSPDKEKLELQKGKPRLVVREEEDRFHLQMVPTIPREHGFALIPVSPTRFQFVHLEEKAGQLLRILSTEGVSIPHAEQERLQSIVLTIHKEGIPVGGGLSMGGAVETVGAPTHLAVRLYPRGQGLLAEVGVEPLGEGGEMFPPGKGELYFLTSYRGAQVEIVRDLATEWESFEKLVDKIPSLKEGHLRISEPEECLEFLLSLRELPPEEIHVQWPQGRNFQLRRLVGWQDMRMSVSQSNEWFAVDAELELSESEHLQLRELISRNQQRVGRFITLDDGSFVALTKTLERKLGALERAAQKEKQGKLLLDPLSSTLLLEDMERLEVDAAFIKSRERLAKARSFEPTLPENFTAQLRPYQRRGYDWLMRSAEWGVGVCLADDMGLGKTVQILAVLAQRASGGPALVVAPTSVCSNWVEECRRFCPGLRPILFSESDRETVLEKLQPGDLLVCSYGLLCRELEEFEKIRWHTLTLDESQAIKNPQTQRFKAAVKLSSDFKIAATGTPVENHLGELWALFRFLNPSLLGGQRKFSKSFSGSDEALEGLKTLVSPFILRRLKSDVLSDLPPKIEVTLKVDLHRDEKLFYESLRLGAVERMEQRERTGVVPILAELMRLRRACCHPRLVDPGSDLPSSKFERFWELLADLRDGGHRALVFSQFVDHLKLVREELDRQKISYQYLDGSTPARARAASVKAFQEGEGDVFLISLKAGGMGLNLTAANYVVHLDPWWNPATEDQASDRTHRIGQKQAVTVYRLVGKDTIEERILALHDEKRELVDTLLAGTDRAGKLSADELLQLLRESVLEPV